MRIILLFITLYTCLSCEPNSNSNYKIEKQTKPSHINKELEYLEGSKTNNEGDVIKSTSDLEVQLKSYLKYKDVTSKKSDLDFYNLVKVDFQDNGLKGSIHLPISFTKYQSKNENTILYYLDFFGGDSGYEVEISRLKSTNTIKFNDRGYMEFMFNNLEKEEDKNFEFLKQILPPTLKEVKVVDLDFFRVINDNHFMRRVLYYKDSRLSGTSLEDVTVLNFHFVTVQNGTKYQLDINYYGNNKSYSDLVNLFSVIGGSIKME